MLIKYLQPNMKSIFITEQRFLRTLMNSSIFSKKLEEKVFRSHEKIRESAIIQNEKPLKNDIFDQQSRGFSQSSAFRSTRSEVFYKKVVTNNFEKFTRKHLWRSLF